MRITVRKRPDETFDVLIEPARRTRLPITLLPQVPVGDIESSVRPVVERNILCEQGLLPVQGQATGLNGLDIP